MTDEQRDFLNNRLKDAAEQQPDIEALRELLLALGGVELVAAPEPDLDLPTLLARGHLIDGTVLVNELDAGLCHENVAEMWLDKNYGLTAIGTGYALSEDGLWRQHSWGIRDGEIVETTSERVKYFGTVMTGAYADAFADANAGDPDERQWRRLPDIWFKLEKDELGYPPKDWESLKGEPTDQANIYRIKNVPFFAKGVAYGDEVLASTSEEGFARVFNSVNRRSGYSTVRLWISDSEDRNALTTYFTDRRCVIELSSNFCNRLVAIAIPKAAFEEIDAYIDSESSNGRWEAQDGYLPPEG